MCKLKKKLLSCLTFKDWILIFKKWGITCLATGRSFRRSRVDNSSKLNMPRIWDATVFSLVRHKVMLTWVIQPRKSKRLLKDINYVYFPLEPSSIIFTRRQLSKLGLKKFTASPKKNSISEWDAISSDLKARRKNQLKRR